MANAQETLLDLFYGRWRSQTLYSGIRLGLFEAMGATPKSADALASELGLDAALSYRLLRALKALRVLDEHDGRAFSLTPAGEMLRGDHPRSMRDAFLLREGPWHTAVWKHLPAIVRDGQQTGFIREFGTDAFDYATRNASTYGADFNAGMSSQSNLQTAWTLEALRDRDLASISHLCDVGGGQGHLLAHVLQQYPHLRGTLFDRPTVVAQRDGPPSWIHKLRLAERCAIVGGDMFADVPAADAYTLKMILHDWNDDECVQILRNLRRRVADSGRVFVIEHVIPDAGGPDYAAMFDMHMMCWGTGQERTASEYGDLLEAAGWAVRGTWYPADGAMGVVEGAAAP
jgi:hypothetical protein